MQASPGGASPGSDLPQMIYLDLDFADFCSDWTHCDRLSGYLAGMVSHNRVDPRLFANLYSTAVNELLEAVFRSHGETGKLECAVQRAGGLDRIVLTFPADEATYRAYETIVAKTGGDEAEACYLQALFADEDPGAGLGLLQLGVDYGARLAVERCDGARMRLVAEFALEDDSE
jgi:hypothetical protein